MKSSGLDVPPAATISDCCNIITRSFLVLPVARHQNALLKVQNLDPQTLVEPHTGSIQELVSSRSTLAKAPSQAAFTPMEHAE